MGNFNNLPSYTNLISIDIQSDESILSVCNSLSISLYNLSATFCLVKYRFYINNTFNDMFNEICKTEYRGYTPISRGFIVSWYNIKRFGRAIYDGNDARRKNIYLCTSDLKWKLFRELRKTFKSYFGQDLMFPPTFETYSTNIRLNNKCENRAFWHSVMFGNYVDYSFEYNLCVCWHENEGDKEGVRLSAYRGENNNVDMDSRSREYVRHELAGTYAVYMVASTMNRIAMRDIAICNKRMSSAMRSRRTHNLFKARVYIENKLYYVRRFANEFSDNTNITNNMKFYNERFKTESMTSDVYRHISNDIGETRDFIDNLLSLSDKAAQYMHSKFSVTISLMALLVAVLSLIAVIVSNM